MLNAQIVQTLLKAFMTTAEGNERNMGKICRSVFAPGDTLMLYLVLSTRRFRIQRQGDPQLPESLAETKDSSLPVSWR
jgi:hypothetical protein